MANPNVILQWNINGLRGNRIELNKLIEDYSPAIICLQETKLPLEFETCDKENPPPSVHIGGYVPYFRCIPSGQNGVAIYVRNNIFHSEIKIGLKWQALAVRVTFQGKQFIVSNHYTPGSSGAAFPTKGHLQEIINKFDKPFIMCGDFNAHNTLWSAQKDDNRGLAIEDFMIENDLGLLNSEINTHLDNATKSWSLLDLSIIHPAIFLDFDCEILPDLHHSDHSPILIKTNEQLFETDKRPRWNFKRANWESFKRQCSQDINEELFESQEDKIAIFTDKLLEIAAENIPMTSPTWLGAIPSPVQAPATVVLEEVTNG